MHSLPQVENISISSLSEVVYLSLGFSLVLVLQSQLSGWNLKKNTMFFANYLTFFLLEEQSILEKSTPISYSIVNGHPWKYIYKQHYTD